MIFGKRTQIPEDKVKFYLAYAKSMKNTEPPEENENDDDEKQQPQDLGEEDEDDFFNIERIVSEYVTIKQVLINNSFPVDIATLQSGQSFYVGAQSTALNLRLLFDKKIFLDLLRELEQVRKVQSVKKKNYLFHIPYEGKDNALDDWRKLVNIRTTQTLKYMNLSRILRIINYDPSMYMNQKKMSMMVSGKREEDEKIYPSFIERPPGSPEKGVDARASYAEASRKGNVGFNLFQILSKYIKVDHFLQGITDIVRRVNDSSLGNSRPEQRSPPRKGSLPKGAG